MAQRPRSSAGSKGRSRADELALSNKLLDSEVKQAKHWLRDEHDRVDRELQLASTSSLFGRDAEAAQRAEQLQSLSLSGEGVTLQQPTAAREARSNSDRAKAVAALSKIIERENTPAHSRDQLEQPFRREDLGRGGTVPVPVFRRALRQLTMEATPIEFGDLLSRYALPDDPDEVDYSEFVDEVEPMLSHNASRARSTRLRQSRAAVAEMGDSEALAKLEAALKDIASRYSRKEGTGISRDRLLSTFREADEDGSGTVSRDEFLRQLTRMRVALSDEEASAVFARLDADDSGAVDYREFVTQLAQHSDGDKQADKADKAGEKGGDARGSQRGKAARRRREAAAETAAKRPPSDDVDTARAKPSSQSGEKRPSSEEREAFVRRALRKAGWQSAPARRLRGVFKRWDTSGDGSVSAREFRDALQEMGLSMSAKEASALAEHFDIDGDGRIRWEEFVLLAGARDEEGAAQQEEEEEKEAEEAAVDPGHVDELEREVRGLLASHGWSVASEGELLRCFTRWDKEQEGTLSSGSFREALRELGFRLSASEARSLLQRFDTDGDGRIRWREFVRLAEPYVLSQAQRRQGAASSAAATEAGASGKGEEEGASAEDEVTAIEKKLRGLVARQAWSLASEEELRQCFTKWDRQGRGYIGRSDFRAAVRELGFPLSREEAAALMARFDASGDGRIRWEEFVRFAEPFVVASERREQTQEAFRAQRNARLDRIERGLRRAFAKGTFSIPSEQALFRAFRAWDKNDSGTISRREFQECLQELGVPLSREDSAVLMTRFDEDGSGRLDFDEFAEFLHPFVDPIGAGGDGAGAGEEGAGAGEAPMPTAPPPPPPPQGIDSPAVRGGQLGARQLEASAAAAADMLARGDTRASTATRSGGFTAAALREERNELRAEVDQLRSDNAELAGKLSEFGEEFFEELEELKYQFAVSLRATQTLREQVRELAEVGGIPAPRPPRLPSTESLSAPLRATLRRTAAADARETGDLVEAQQQAQQQAWAETQAMTQQQQAVPPPLMALDASSGQWVPVTPQALASMPAFAAFASSTAGAEGEEEEPPRRHKHRRSKGRSRSRGREGRRSKRAEREEGEAHSADEVPRGRDRKERRSKGGKRAASPAPDRPPRVLRRVVRDLGEDGVAELCENIRAADRHRSGFIPTSAMHSAFTRAGALVDAKGRDALEAAYVGSGGDVSATALATDLQEVAGFASSAPATRAGAAEPEPEEWRALREHFREQLGAAGSAGDLLRAFQRADADNSGALAPREVTDMLFDAGIDVGPKEERALFSRLDSRGDGRVQFDEFAQFVRDVYGEGDDSAEAAAAGAHREEREQRERWLELRDRLEEGLAAWAKRLEKEKGGSVDAAARLLKKFSRAVPSGAKRRHVLPYATFVRVLDETTGVSLSQEEAKVLAREKGGHPDGVDFHAAVDAARPSLSPSADSSSAAVAHAVRAKLRRLRVGPSMHSVFRRFDRSGDGVIDDSELERMLRSLGVELSEGEQEWLMGEIDRDGSGSVSLKELERFAANRDGIAAGNVAAQRALVRVQRQCAAYPELDVLAPFRKRDPGSRGTVTEREFLAALSDAGLSLADGDARSLAGAFAGKARGATNYREFLFAAARKQGFKGKWTKGSMTSLQGMFARFDVDNSGRLEKQEFRRAAEAAGLKLHPWEVEGVMEQFDRDGRGIDYRDFSEFILEAETEVSTAVGGPPE